MSSIKTSASYLILRLFPAAQSRKLHSPLRSWQNCTDESTVTLAKLSSKKFAALFSSQNCIEALKTVQCSSPYAWQLL